MTQILIINTSYNLHSYINFWQKFTFFINLSKKLSEQKKHDNLQFCENFKKRQLHITGVNHKTITTQKVLQEGSKFSDC